MGESGQRSIAAFCYFFLKELGENIPFQQHHHPSQHTKKEGNSQVLNLACCPVVQ